MTHILRIHVWTATWFE